MKPFFIFRIRTAIAMFAAAAVMSPALASAANAASQSNDDAKTQHALANFHPRTPGTPVHTEFEVEVNKLGQVTRVRKGHSSNNDAFNSITYGNALQAFIRTSDGHAISGLYRLSYDYDPKTKLVKRDVALIHAGGVNPNAPGAVLEMQKIEQKRANEGDSLPNLSQVAEKHRRPRR